MIFEYSSWCSFSPVGIGKRWKVYTNKCSLRLLILYEGWSDGWEGIYGFLFSFIFEICIDFESGIIKVMEMSLLNLVYISISDREYNLSNLDIVIVSVELALQKTFIVFFSLEEESNLSSDIENIKWIMGRLLPTMETTPFWAMECIMECCEHFSSDENSLFIRAINGNLESDERRVSHSKA